VVAGAVAAVFGGSNLQVSGPTGAMTVVLVPVAHDFGRSGVLTVGAMAGLLLITMAVVGAGRYVRYLPVPVVEGFTAGIAVVIALQQLPAALGVPPRVRGEGLGGRRGRGCPLRPPPAAGVGADRPRRGRGEPPWISRRVLIQPGRLIVMSAPRKYDEEFRDRAVRLYRDRLAEAPGSLLGARKYVGALLDLNPAMLRTGWRTASGPGAAGYGNEGPVLRPVHGLNHGRDGVVVRNVSGDGARLRHRLAGQRVADPPA
jgi:hypothetical protein